MSTSVQNILKNNVNENVQDYNITSFYITFSIIAMAYTTVLIVTILINKDVFVYIFMVYILFLFIYLHIVSFKNRKTLSRNAFFSLRQTSLIYIFNYVTIVLTIAAFIVISIMTKKNKTIF